MIAFDVNIVVSAAIPAEKLNILSNGAGLKIAPPIRSTIGNLREKPPCLFKRLKI